VTRILIPHLDDVGMCHGANRACLELMGRGFVSSASVMVPCPWFPEIAEAASARPELDLGIHLTLTSEWPTYRWRPISTASKASGLIDGDGFMWRDVPSLRRHVDVVAAEEEMRAQIEAGQAAGIDATHIDTHMGAAVAPELVDIYLALGREYRLPVLLPRDLDSYVGALKLGQVDLHLYAERVAALERDRALFVDTFRITPCVSPAESDAVYRRMVAELPPGVTFFSLHANAPGDIETISPRWAPWRTDEYRLCADPAFHTYVRDQGVELECFGSLRDRLRAGSGA
jgi:chitin disaccharide deacetylase